MLFKNMIQEQPKFEQDICSVRQSYIIFSTLKSIVFSLFWGGKSI